MKITALSGILGYGYTEEGLQGALAQNPDIIGVDGGSQTLGHIIWDRESPLAIGVPSNRLRLASPVKQSAALLMIPIFMAASSFNRLQTFLYP